MRNRYFPLACAAVSVTAVLGVVAGCSDEQDDRGIGDAPSEQEPDQPRRIYPNANLFPNVATMCIGGNGVYTQTRDGHMEVVVDDPECDEGGALVPQDD